MSEDLWEETTHPMPSSSTTFASSDEGSVTARIGFPAAIILYILLGTERPAIPGMNDMTDRSHALCNSHCFFRSRKERKVTFPSLFSATRASSHCFLAPFPTNKKCMS